MLLTIGNASLSRSDVDTGRGSSPDSGEKSEDAALDFFVGPGLARTNRGGSDHPPEWRPYAMRKLRAPAGTKSSAFAEGRASWMPLKPG
jgi:hypothetical protein